MTRVTSDDLRIRELAVERVDRRHGYTMEFAPSPAQHREEYDREEQKLRIEVSHDPGLILCGHENRHHYMGGGLKVCFHCLLGAFGFKART